MLHVLPITDAPVSSQGLHLLGRQGPGVWLCSASALPLFHIGAAVDSERVDRYSGNCSNGGKYCGKHKCFIFIVLQEVNIFRKSTWVTSRLENMHMSDKHCFSKLLQVCSFILGSISELIQMKLYLFVWIYYIFSEVKKDLASCYWLSYYHICYLVIAVCRETLSKTWHLIFCLLELEPE